MTSEIETPRIATVAEAQEVAMLLDRFNCEFDTPSPGLAVLTARLERLLSGCDVVALLAGYPAVAVALLTLRPNVWCEGSVALLDELYVVPAQRRRGIGAVLLKTAEAVVRERGGELLEINVDGEDTDARRFYERYGYANHDPEQTQPQLLLPPLSRSTGLAGLPTFVASQVSRSQRRRTWFARQALLAGWARCGRVHVDE